MDYIPEAEASERLSSVRLAAGYQELMDIAAEWNGLYGLMPPPTHSLFKYSHLQSATRRLGISSLEVHNWHDNMLMTVDERGRELDPEDIFCAQLSGPHIDAERWRVLLEEALDSESRMKVQLDAESSVIRITGLQKKQQSKWIDSLLAILLPVVEYVEKASL